MEGWKCLIGWFCWLWTNTSVWHALFQCGIIMYIDGVTLKNEHPILAHQQISVDSQKSNKYIL